MIDLLHVCKDLPALPGHSVAWLEKQDAAEGITAETDPEVLRFSLEFCGTERLQVVWQLPPGRAEKREDRGGPSYPLKHDILQANITEELKEPRRGGLARVVNSHEVNGCIQQDFPLSHKLW